MSHKLQFRDAVASDLPTIVEIYNSTIPSRMVTSDLEPVSVESREAWFEAHTPDRWPLWIAEDNEETLGWLSFSRFVTRAAYDITAELSIYIDERHRKRGIGKALLTRAIAHAPTIGFSNLIGLIFAHNYPSVGLFHKFGFAKWGDLPSVCLLDNVERDVAILGRRLAPATR